MPTITVMPHAELCPEGLHFEAQAGDNLLDSLEANGVLLEHACEKMGVCTTCHLWIREGGETVSPPGEVEEDHLGEAWGLDPDSRLSCQVWIGKQSLLIEIPRYTRNVVGERR
jgi:2Fe-2S ferredoxin